MRDLEAIGEFVARDDPEAAGRLVTRIITAVESLGAHPHLGRAGRIVGTRELVIGGTPYLAPYRVVGEDVQVLAVIHGARRCPERLG